MQTIRDLEVRLILTRLTSSNCLRTDSTEQRKKEELHRIKEEQEKVYSEKRLHHKTHLILQQLMKSQILWISVMEDFVFVKIVGRKG